MTSPKASAPAEKVQPSLFDDLSKVLSAENAKAVPLVARSGDIGGELIAILSKGLYTNPLDCLREYAQNGVDARATTITLKITGNTVMVFDDGVGMGLAEMLEAKKFGVSPKSITQHVGFRGIGIYSGFDLCRRLIVTSSRAGAAAVYRLVFEFAKMRAQLEAERNDPDANRTSLTDLLTAHTTIARVADGQEETHYTSIELRDIQPEHIALLSDRRRLREYLLQSLPIAFAPSFPYGAAIDARLREVVPGYNPIAVKLQLDGQPEETVQKYGATHKQLAEYAADPNKDHKPVPALELSLAPPIFREVRSNGVTVAFYWACLNKARSRLEPKEEKPQFEGFIYKVKGFSIGDREKLRPLFTRGQLYPWFTGEVYVIDSTVVPNAERNDFETSASKTALEVAILNDFTGHLKPAAEKFQAQAKATESVAKYAALVDAIESDLNLSTADERILNESDIERLTQLGNLIEDLPSRRRALKEDADAVGKVDALLNRAKAVRKALTRVLENPTGEIAKRRRAAEDGSGTEPKPAPSPPPPPRLHEVIAENGVELDKQASRLLDLFQSALDDLLPVNGGEYRRFVAYLSERLSDATDIG